MCETCGSLTHLKSVVEKFKIPFKCKKCGSIDFPLKAVRDVVYIWESVPPTKLGDIIIPDFIQEKFRNTKAVVLSAGPGYYDKAKRKYIASEVKTGQVVLADQGTPWRMDVKASDGKEYSVKYLGEKDIKCVLLDE